MGGLKKIYTRRGDQGETRLLSGERVAKDDMRVKTYGAVDELQSHLGLARSLTNWNAVSEMIREVQADLLVVGAELATGPEAHKRPKETIGTDQIRKLEDRIDEIASCCGMPKGFVIPGHDSASAAIHVARTVCRRCERLIVALNRKAPGCDLLIQYFNRLGDLLFMLAWAAEFFRLLKEAVQDALEGPLAGRER